MLDKFPAFAQALRKWPAFIDIRLYSMVFLPHFAKLLQEKEARAGTVISSDIHDVSCRDAGTAACALGRETDRHVIGDIEHFLSCPGSPPHGAVDFGGK